MNFLEEKILRDGVIKEGNILKVDSFLNHQIDVDINRFTIATGAIIMLLGGIFPPVGALLTTIPQAVLGGCTIMMFGSILFAGFGMMSKSGFTPRNMIITSLSLSVGLGFTQATGMFKAFPQIIQSIFSENCVAVVFLLAVILNLVLPKDKAENN